ncbi:MFS general substrate transporter [Karstenula rhodostoma CBS 690.94]|uniref:MFS general substrate transporter n=1 Tax=Karstenula rhodostoma CBS 690.94 TaxID=1392251 RepID=A0A9P4UG63_9PLEO|nr:MFS general substrate transporter [Karstenula rhodostoma CBS 690.94]
MARQTPQANRWPSQTLDEERPLLDDADVEAPSLAAKLPARRVTSAKTHHDPFLVDHGWLPWLQVIAGWFLFANSWGLPTAYGTFQTYYTQNLLFKYDSATIAWIGSLQLFLCTMGCLPAGIMLDQGYLQGLIAVGSALEVIGLVAVSFSTRYWQILLAQGALVGMGCGVLGLLPVAVISMYFEERRMLAVGLAATGASFAGIVQPIILKYLFEHIGFSWAVRMLALTILFSSTIPFFVMRLQSEGAEVESRFGLHHFKDLTYSTFVCTFTLIQAAAMAPLFFVQEYALSLGIDETMAFHLLAILNIAGLFGRCVPNFIADHYGGINTLLPLMLTCIILLVTLPWFNTLPSLVIFCVLYGFASAGTLILPAPIITKLSTGTADLGVRMGLAYLFAAFGGLVGNPLSGSAKKENDPDAVWEFRGVWWVAAGILTMAFCALLCTRRLKVGSVFGQCRV